MPDPDDTLTTETLSDDEIGTLRGEARIAEDHELARACSAALGLRISDGALGILDARVCRGRVVAWLNARGGRAYMRGIR